MEGGGLETGNQLGHCNSGKSLPNLSTNKCRSGEVEITDVLELMGFGIWTYIKKRYQGHLLT